MRCAKPLLVLLSAAALALSACASPPKKSSRKASRPPATASPSSAKKPAKKATTRKSRAKKSTTRKPVAKKAPPARTAKRAAPPARPAAPAAPALTPKARYAQALELLKSNQWQGAEAALLASVKDYPRDAGPQTNLGIVYARTDRKAEARTAFQRAVQVNGRNTVAHNWLGVLARQDGDYAAAERAYRQALAANPSSADAQLNLAILYDQYLKRPAEALAAYRRYQALTGNKDLRAAVWIAELEARLPKPAPAAAPRAPAAKKAAPPRKAPARKGAKPS